jgi:hypothetical protein
LAVLLARRSYINDASVVAVAAKPLIRTTGVPPGNAAFLKLKTTVLAERLIVNIGWEENVCRCVRGFTEGTLNPRPLLPGREKGRFVLVDESFFRCEAAGLG